MSLKQEWSQYRLTALLYLGVLAIPLVLSMVFTSLGKLEQGTETIRELGRMGGNIMYYVQETNPEEEERARLSVDEKMEVLAKWFSEHSTSDLQRYYVGPTTPKEDFEKLRSCWEELKKDRSLSKARVCLRQSNTLTFAVERMISGWIAYIRNMMVLAIVLSVGLLLLAVFVVRYLVYHQICKNVLRGDQREIYGREYCQTALERSCAQAERLKQNLSTVEIRFPSLGEDSSLNVDEKAQMLDRIEDVMKTITRRSDIPCRVAKDCFLIILPHAGERESTIATQRLEGMLYEKLSGEFPHLKPVLQRTTRSAAESCDDYLKRAMPDEEA